MGGFFGVASRRDCVSDLFFGTDYHSHLGTMRGGLAVKNRSGIMRTIHDITNAQFRSKFENDIGAMHGRMGIGVISDYEDQPVLVGSHLGMYAIVTVGMVRNLDKLAAAAFKKRATHFSEMARGEVNPTELVATLINQEASFTDGLRAAQEVIEGSCSILLLTHEGLYAARDRVGRTAVTIGRRDGAYAVSMETCAFPNLDYTIDKWLGPGEIVHVTAEGVETVAPPGDRLRICAFLWIYYGYPASSYEGLNAEDARNRCGAALARADSRSADLVAGVPDSGTAHAIGYAIEAGIPFRRPFVKYTPTWARSFMPQDQSMRDRVARMKLIPIREIIDGKRLLFCEDSIVRGTQLKDIVERLYDYGAREVHMRAACPPLVHGCRFLNFSRSKSELDLAARKAIAELEPESDGHIADYACPGSERHAVMVSRICSRLKLTSLKYQTLDDMVAAIGLPREHLCTCCWTGDEA